MPAPEPAVVTLEPATTAVIRRVVPMDGLPEFFDGSFGALAAAVTEQGAGVAGPASRCTTACRPTRSTSRSGSRRSAPSAPTATWWRARCPAAASPGRCTRARSTGSARPGGGCATGSMNRVCGREDLLGGVPDPADAGHGSRRPADPAQLAGRVSRVNCEGGGEMPSLSANGTELYYEIRGTGPPVLLIMGATGDGGHFDVLADLLADEFTVVSYDRRGNGRSPAPTGWTTTSPEEQADDAAALCDELGTVSTAVFGTSSGGISRSVCWSGIPNRCGAGSCTSPGCMHWSTTSTRFGARASPLRRGDGSGWPAGRGDALALRGRRRQPGEAGAGPARAAPRRSAHVRRGRARNLRAVPARRRRWPRCPLPLHLIVSDDSLPAFTEIAHRLGRRLGGGGRRHPWRARGYHDRPRELAERLRPFSAGSDDQPDRAVSRSRRRRRVPWLWRQG